MRVMSDETTTSEQLAEIEGQATDYTPPDGWRVVPLSEALRGGDEYHPGLDRYIRRIESGPQPEPQPEPEPQATDYTPPEGWRLVETHEELDIPGRDQYVRGPNRYIRPIDPQPQPQPVQVREGRWRKRSGAEVSVSAMPTDHDHFLAAFPWWDGQESTWTHSGHLLSGGECPADLVEYLGPIESEPQQEPQPQPADTAIEELRSEVSYVQNLLGESRQRVTQLEELVTSLRTINDAAERAIEDAGTENTALHRQLAVVKEELTTAAAVSHQLQIELDAAQQVPADSPDLQQLRLRLADMTLDRDQYKDAYDSTFDDLLTTRETTKAETVEAITEWLQHFRGCNSPSLALLLLEALPHIMRSLTGLADEEIE
jgi:hypothetical protein